MPDYADRSIASGAGNLFRRIGLSALGGKSLPDDADEGNRKIARLLAAGDDFGRALIFGDEGQSQPAPDSGDVASSLVGSLVDDGSPELAEAAAQPGAATPIQDTRGDPMMGLGGAAVQPARMMTVGSTTNTSRKRAKVSKGEAAADIAARNAATTRAIDANENYASQNAEILVGEANRLQGAYREQGEQLSSIGAESKALKQRFARLDDELTQAREDVKGSVPIAGATLPTYTRILTGLAAIMEGFAAGVNRRKSNAGQLVQTALNRDLQAQRAVYMDKLRDMNLTQQQRGEAMRRLDVMWGRQQTVLYRQAQLKAAEIGHRTKSLAVNKQATDTVFALGEAARDSNMRVTMASRDDVTTNTTTQRALVGGGGAGGAPANLDKTEAREFKGKMASFQFGQQTLGEIERVVAGMSYKLKRGTGIPTPDMTKLKGLLKDYALVHRKVMGDKGPIRGDDFENFERLNDPSKFAAWIGGKSGFLSRVGFARKQVAQSMHREAKLLLTPAGALAQQVLAGRAPIDTGAEGKFGGVKQ